MSITKDYLERLDTEVGIAPAGSQEELDCAHGLAEEFSAHGLKTEVEDFSAPSLGYVPYGAALVLLFLGLILLGVGGTATTIIGFVLVVAMLALLWMTYTGKDVIGKFGPSAHSQNVVAVREAEVDPAERERPIVVVAHYDTGRLDFLSRPQVAVAKKYIASYSLYLAAAVAVCSLIQFLGFIPEPARRTFWVIGLIACLPLLVWGISLIASRFMPYAPGSVDNKSSVAAMLGVMDRVTQGVEVKRPENREADVAPESVSEPKPREPEMRREVEEVVGTRHGEKVIRELGILPPECSITYIEPEVRMVPVATPVEEPQPTQVSEPVSASALETEPIPVVPQPEGDEADSEPAMTDEPTVTVEPEDEEAGATRPMVAIDESRIDTSNEVDAGATFSMDANSLSQLEDGQSTDEGPLTETDHSGLYTMADEDATEATAATRPERPRPNAVADPDWGKSSYKPTRRANVSNVARRAALFDLPDPKTSGQDGLGPAPTQLPQRSQMAQRLADASQQVTSAPSQVRFGAAAQAPRQQAAPQPDDIEVLSAPVASAPTSGSTTEKGHGHGRLSGLFGRKKKQEESMSEWLGVDDDYDAKKSGESIGSWDNFGNEHGDSHWKGGAALNINLRKLKDKLPSIPGHDSGEEPQDLDEADTNADVVADDASATGADAPVENEAPVTEQPGDDFPYVDSDVPVYNENIISSTDRALRDSILAMGDSDLRAHDIWFVATGASSLNHAGASAFVDAHRKDLRGAFVVNLDCVGAGDLALLTQEGFGTSRRSDRRFLSLLESVASDLHLGVEKVDRSWANTDATMLMRKRMRAVTLMGLGAGDLPACAHTAEDVSANVSTERIEDVCALVLEAIRRA